MSIFNRNLEMIMLYSEILDALYNREIDDVIKILNMSVYSTSLNKSNDELLVVHTGFSFSTHKGKEMEIYAGFSISDDKIIVIRQTRADWAYRWVPLINGLLVKITAKNHYLSEIDRRLCNVIEEIDNNYKLCCVEYEKIDDVLNLDSKELIENFGPFTIKKETGNLTFPWHKKLKQHIYLNGTRFSKTQPVEADDAYDFDKHQSLDEYLRDDYGDDAETAYWNVD